MISNVSRSPFQDIKSQANMPHFPLSSSTHLTSTFISSLISPSSNCYQKVPKLNQRQLGKVESFLPTIQKIFKVIVGILIFPLGIYWLYEYWWDKSKEKSLETFVDKIEDLPDYKDRALYADETNDPAIEQLLKHLDSEKIEPYSSPVFNFSVSELEKMKNSVRLSYDKTLADIDFFKQAFGNPFNPNTPDVISGRILSNLCVSLYDSEGNSRQIKNRELSFFRIYTCNLPKIYQWGTLSNYTIASHIGTYEKDLTNVLIHFFQEAEFNENKVVIFPPLNKYLYDHEKGLEKSFPKALEEALRLKGQSFDKIIFADPDLEKDLKEIKQRNDFSNVIITSKDFLEIAHLGAEKGFNIGLFNPTAIYFAPKQIAWSFLQKKFVHCTSLLIGQIPFYNKQVRDTSLWKPYTPC